MFRAFVDGATPNSPTPAVTGSAPARSGNAGKVIGITLAVVVIVLIAFLAF
jgi:hypothetical protein